MHRPDHIFFSDAFPDPGLWTDAGTDLSRNPENISVIDPIRVNVDFSVPGMRIYRQNETSPWPVIVHTAVGQARWEVYSNQPGFLPGLVVPTLLYEGRDYCIAEAEEGASGAWVYRLKPWPKGEVWQRVVELNRKTIEEKERRERQMAREELWSHRSAYYDLFLGFLPGRLQDFLGEKLHFSAEEASRKNALVEYFVVFPLCFVGFIEPLEFIVSGEFYTPLGAGLGLFALAVEGALRWGHVVSSNRPCGLLALEILDGILRFATAGLGCLIGSKRSGSPRRVPFPG
ncbi:hypothetical protein HQ520_01420 [bacterium]|nr:hypothetical protein [bacterium]